MGGTVFPPCWLTWGQTMLEVMKLMGTSFKMSCACTAPDQCPCSCSSHHQPMPLLETPGHSWASLGQSLVGVTAPFSWVLVHKVLFVPSKSQFPQSYVSSGGSMMGLMVTSSKRAYAIPRSAAFRTPASVAGHCWPVALQETLRHSKVGLVQSLWVLLVYTRFCLSPLSISGEYGVWF